MGPTDELQGETGTPFDLAAFLRAERATILAMWEAAARELPAAGELDRAALLDHLPNILDEIAGMAEGMSDGQAIRGALADSDRHALERLDEGYDLADVVREFALLRECVLQLWEQRRNGAVGSTLLNRAIDHAISASVARFAQARDRTLVALERISAAALGSPEQQSFLRSLVRVLVETCDAVDAGLLLLREGDALVVRAEVGLGGGVREGACLPTGGSLLGHVLGTGESVAVRDAAHDARVAAELPPLTVAHALDLLPLSHGEQTIGIAIMGSRTAYEFSQEDRLLFRVMVERATAIIVQAQLTAERERLAGQMHAVLQQMPSGVQIAEAPSGQLVFGNARGEEIAGGAPIGTVGARHPDGRPYTAEESPLVRAARTGEQVVDEEILFQHPSDGARHLLVSAVPVRDSTQALVASVSVFSDVTAERRASLQARLLVEATEVLGSSLEFRATLTRLAHLAARELSDGCAIYVHAEEEPEAVARVVREGVDPAAWQRIWPAEQELALRVLSDGKPLLCEDLARRIETHCAGIARTGVQSGLWVPLVSRGQTLGVLSLLTTTPGCLLTGADLEFASELARRAALTVDHALLYTRAQEAVRARDEFLSIASHDLRSPLTSLRLQVQSLLRRARKGALDPEWTTPKLETMDRQVERIGQLLGDLLDVSRIHAGHLRFELEELDLAALVHDVVSRFEELLQASGSSVEVHADREIPGIWDRLRLEQVATNLISNAVKYGGGRPIAVHVRGDAARAWLVVADQGQGIAPEHRQRIFERFERADRSEAIQGTGLGLWIVRQIVEGLGGTIRVDSELGHGSTFTVELPRRPPIANQ